MNLIEPRAMQYLNYKFSGNDRYLAFLDARGIRGKMFRQLTQEEKTELWGFLRYLNGEIELDPSAERIIAELLA